MRRGDVTFRWEKKIERTQAVGWPASWKRDLGVASKLGVGKGSEA